MTSREFKHLYHKLFMPLCMFALRITEDVDMAQDAVQTSFMRVWEMICNGYEIQFPERYMYMSVRNTAIAMLRADKMFTPLPDDSEEVAEEEIDTAERDARLWEAIENMPPRRREVFLLSKRDGLSYKAIAEELNISVKTVENQMSKALASLKADKRHLAFLISFL